MKYFLLLFLVGIASAASISDHDDLDVCSSYMDVLELADIPLAAVGADDEPSDLEKKLRDKFDETIEKIKDLIDKGKDVKEDLLEKAKELREKLKELKVKISDKAKEMLDEIKKKVKDWFENFFDKFGNKDKRFIRESIKELLRKLRVLIKDKFDTGKLEDKVKKIFGEDSELGKIILNYLKEKGEMAKQKLLDFIDRILDNKDEREERSLAELWEKIKDYFKDLGIELKEKFMKFGEWVREHMKNLKDKAKTKHEKIKEIARELIDHAKEMGKDIFAEGMEFLRPYKEDLGSLWDQIKETAKDFLGKKD